MLHRPLVAQITFQPDIPVSSEIRVEHIREFVKRDPRSDPCCRRILSSAFQGIFPSPSCRGRTSSLTSTWSGGSFRRSQSIRASGNGARSCPVPLGALALFGLGACAQKRRVRHLRVRGRPRVRAANRGRIVAAVGRGWRLRW